MKLILRFIALKMSILRVDVAIINPKTVKPNLYPSRIIVGTDMKDERLVEAAHTFAELLQDGLVWFAYDTRKGKWIKDRNIVDGMLFFIYRFIN